VFNPINPFSVLPQSSTAFRGSLFLLGRATSLTSPDTESIDLTQFLPKQQSFVIFGRNKRQSLQNNLQIGSRENLGHYSEISPLTSRVGLVLDHSSRSSAIVGDIDNDGFDDLVLGFPYISTCFVYYGTENGFTNDIVSFAMYGATAGDEFGWSVSKAGDVNSDLYADFIICAKAASICYVFYGKQDFSPQIYLKDFSSADGFRIFGKTAATVNFGIAVDFARDFNGDSRPDLLISAKFLNNQGVVYVIYGREQQLNDIYLEKIQNSSSSLFIITTSAFSFAGMSVTGIGDVNDDGFADVAVGSVPYQAGYVTQRTYVVYGGTLEQKESNTLSVKEMIAGVDGFTISGGGFLVSGLGDVNEDGIDDLMITSYYDWQGQTNAYLISYPNHKNMNLTSPPTFLPSSLPSSSPSLTPSSTPTRTGTMEYPSNVPFRVTSPPLLSQNETNRPTTTTKPTSLPTTKKTSSPSLSPTQKPSTNRPTRNPTFAPTYLVVHSMRPSHRLSSRPTQQTTNDPRFPSGHILDSNITIYINESAFETIYCDKPGEYQGKDFRNQIFVLSSPGDYRIKSRSSLTARFSPKENDQNTKFRTKFVKIFRIYPVINQQVDIEVFDPDTDVINLSKFPSSSLRTIQDLSYTDHPLMFLLPAENDDHQTIILPEFSDLSFLSDRNFVFSSDLADSSATNSGVEFSSLLKITAVNGSNSLLIIFCGVMLLVASMSVCIECVRADLESEGKEKEIECDPQEEANEKDSDEKKLKKTAQEKLQTANDSERKGEEEMDEENQLVMVRKRNSLQNIPQAENNLTISSQEEIKSKKLVVQSSSSSASSSRNAHSPSLSQRSHLETNSSVYSSSASSVSFEPVKFTQEYEEEHNVVEKNSSPSTSEDEEEDKSDSEGENSDNSESSCSFHSLDT
jgi:hypothetical protein